PAVGGGMSPSPASRCAPRFIACVRIRHADAVHTSVSPAVTVALTSCTRRPGRAMRVATSSGASGTGRRLSIVKRAACTGGELVLLLHGFPQSASCWRPALTRLAAEGFRGVAISQRGYSAGALPESVDAYHMRELRADVVAVADALGRESFHLAGHDWGGMV